MDRNLILESKRVTLKPIMEASKSEMKAMLLSNEIKKTYMLPDFHDEEELDKYFYRLKSITENINKFVYGIYLKDTLIGFLNEVDKKEGGLNQEKENNLQKARLEIMRKYGKNAILKGMDLEEGATTIDRNSQIGGHKA